jgi:hypothetical protein
MEDALKAQRIYGETEVQRSSLISFVSKAFELAKRYPSEGVLTYAVKKAASVSFDTDNADMYEALLRASIVHDSSTLPLVTRLLFDRQRQGQIKYIHELRDTFSRLIIFYAKFQPAI